MSSGDIMDVVCCSNRSFCLHFLTHTVQTFSFWLCRNFLYKFHSVDDQRGNKNIDTKYWRRGTFQIQTHNSERYNSKGKSAREKEPKTFSFIAMFECIASPLPSALPSNANNKSNREKSLNSGRPVQKRVRRASLRWIQTATYKCTNRVCTILLRRRKKRQLWKNFCVWFIITHTHSETFQSVIILPNRFMQYYFIFMYCLTQMLRPYFDFGFGSSVKDSIRKVFFIRFILSFRHKSSNCILFGFKWEHEKDGEEQPNSVSVVHYSLTLTFLQITVFAKLSLQRHLPMISTFSKFSRHW